MFLFFFILIAIGKSSDDIQDEEDEFALSRLENDPELLSLAKNSIFSLDTIAEVRKRRGYEAARQFFHGRGAVLFQILVFSIAVGYLVTARLKVNAQAYACVPDVFLGYSWKLSSVSV